MGRRRTAFTGNVLAQLDELVARARPHMQASDLDAALTEAETGTKLVDETGGRVFTLLPHIVTAYVALHRDDLVAAEQAVDRAVVELATSGPSLGSRFLLWITAAVAEARGDVEAAYTGLRNLWAVTDSIRDVPGWRVFLPDLVRLARTREPALAQQATAAAAEGARRTSRGCSAPTLTH